MKDVLICGDCLEAMKEIPDASVDAIICDLPYQVLDEDWDFIIDPVELYSQYKRVCRQDANVLLFCGMELGNALLNTFAKHEYCYDIVWVKNNKTRFLSSGKMPKAQHELILFFQINKGYNKDLHKELRAYLLGELKKSGKTLKDIIELTGRKNASHWFRNGGGFYVPTKENYEKLQKVTGCFPMEYDEVKRIYENEKPSPGIYNDILESDVIYCSTPKQQDRVHPTQKPLELLRTLIKAYTNEGDTVLDNTMGSGTTCVACIKENRHYIGIEKDPGYFDVAMKRIENEKLQLSLFN